MRRVGTVEEGGGREEDEGKRKVRERREERAEARVGKRKGGRRGEAVGERENGGKERWKDREKEKRRGRSILVLRLALMAEEERGVKLVL